MKILFIVPYPSGEAPSQRFRFEQYFGILSQKGYSFTVKSFLTLSDWQTLYSKGQRVQKTAKLLLAFARRLFLLFSIGRFDFVFIHREAAPVGPPVFEWFIAKVLRKKIIYDFDDAIWLTDKVNESSIEKIIRWRSKAKLICKWSYRVSCGNEYLCTYARQFASRVIYNPTTIDTDSLHNPALVSDKKIETVIIGWTGSHSTLKYLKGVEPALHDLEQRYPQVEFLIIANQKPKLKLRSLKFLPWRKESEAEDLAKIDIGIMPLPDDEWANGKCGFKALQYLALEIPAVVSPVGVNKKIIDPGENGFLCSTQQEWIAALDQLISNKKLREQMGKKGRQKVVVRFSVKSNTQNFLALFT